MMQLKQTLWIAMLGAALSACGDDDKKSTSSAEDTSATAEVTTPSTDSTGVLSGQILNYYSGEPLSGAQVTLTRFDAATNSTVVIGTQRSSADGSFRFDSIGTSDRFVLTAALNGYGTVTEIVSNSADDPEITSVALALNADLSEAFNSSAPIDLIVDGRSLLTLPADSLVTAMGEPYDGPVTANVTLIDPSSDPELMPGDYRASIPNSSETLLLQSFGAIDIDLADAAGNSLSLAPDVTPTLSIPVAAAMTGNSPASLLLYYFDDASGLWVEAGSASLTNTSAGPVYQGEIDRLAVWNADLPMETITINGCITSQEGDPVTNARVTLNGQDYIGSSVAYSDADGQFSAPVRTNSSVLINSAQGAESDTLIVTTGASPITLEECLILAAGSATVTLTWGENPRDLDTHLSGPSTDDDFFQLYFGRKKVIVDTTTIDLDVDDTSSYGPEITTIPDFPRPGLYRYSIHHYTGSDTLASSDARVELNLNGVPYIYSVNQAISNTGNERWWHVFDLRVTEAGDVLVEPIQTLLNNRPTPNDSASAAAYRTPLKSPQFPEKPWASAE